MNTQYSTFNMFFVIFVAFDALLFVRSFSSPLDGTLSTESAATVGDLIILPCPRAVNNSVNWWYQASPDSHIIELCVNGELINGNKKRFHLDRNTYNLILVNATLNDSGIYTCVDENGFGQNHIVQLTIARSYRKTLTAFVGEPVVLSCQTAAVDTPANWLFQTSDSSVALELCINGALVNGYNQRFYVDNSSYSLQIKELQLKDSGVYTCIENMGFGEHYITELIAIESTEKTLHLNFTSSNPTRLSDRLPDSDQQYSAGMHVNATTITLIAVVVILFGTTVITTTLLIAKYNSCKLHQRDLSDNDFLITDTAMVEKHLEFWTTNARETTATLKVPTADTVKERNIFVLTQYPELHKKYVEMLSEHIQKHHRDVAIIAGLDIRGLIFALPIAQRLRRPFVPISKSGQLYCSTIDTVRKSYITPDGQVACMEVQKTACRPGHQVVIVDDEIRTGVSMSAAIECIRAVGGVVVECVFVTEVLGRGGREKIASCDEAPTVFSLLQIRANNDDNAAIEM